jgi:predicted oxidoreductase (fatty acid repression mutant protein)
MVIISLRLPSQIEIRYANDDIAEVPFEIISHTKNTFDYCIEQKEVVLLTENGRLWNTIKDLKKEVYR